MSVSAGWEVVAVWVRVHHRNSTGLVGTVEQIEQQLVPMGTTIGTIPERQLREIGKLPPEQWSSR